MKNSAVIARGYGESGGYKVVGVMLEVQHEGSCDDDNVLFLDNVNILVRVDSKFASSFHWEN